MARFNNSTSERPGEVLMPRSTPLLVAIRSTCWPQRAMAVDLLVTRPACPSARFPTQKFGVLLSTVWLCDCFEQQSHRLPLCIWLQHRAQAPSSPCEVSPARQRSLFRSSFLAQKIFYRRGESHSLASEKSLASLTSVPGTWVAL